MKLLHQTIAVHCVVHKQTLVAKQLNETKNANVKNDLEVILDDVAKIVNCIRALANNNRTFNPFSTAEFAHSDALLEL